MRSEKGPTPVPIILGRNGDFSTIFVILSDSGKLIKSSVMYPFGFHVALTRLPKLDGLSLVGGGLHLSAHVGWLAWALGLPPRGKWMHDGTEPEAHTFSALLFFAKHSHTARGDSGPDHGSTTYQQASIDKNQDRLSAWCLVRSVPRSFSCLTSKFVLVVLETSMYFSGIGNDSSLGE